MRKLLLKWLGLRSIEDGYVKTIIEADEQGKSPNYRIGMIKSINSFNVLEVGTYKQNTNSRHSEWEYEFYVVEPDQKLSEALSIVLTMKGLEK